jgi:phage tail-like protein
MAAQLTDPYRGFRFKVEIAGIQIAAFAEAMVPTTTVETVDYREGTDPVYMRPQSGLTSYGTLSLKKGLTDSMDLYNWQILVSEQGSGASGAKKNISLILMDADGTEKVRWNIINAFPTQYESTGFNAANSEVMVESLELTLDYIVRAS